MQYNLPPWLSQPANPAAHYVTGLQIGVRIGAEQASQQFAQQQMLREQQKDEFQRQYQSQAMQMKIDEVTRKQKAITDYQNMLNQGVDPMKALMQIGPELGEDPSAMLRVKMMQDEQAQRLEFQKSQLQETARYHSGELAKRSSALLEAQDLATEQQKLDALPVGSPERKKQQDIVDAMMARHGMEETEITTPGGPTVRITKGAGKRGTQALTTAEETRMGDDIQASANSLRVLNTLQKQLDSNAVGIVPTISSFVLDRVLSQFDRELVNQKRVEARQNIGIATQQVLGELNNRGRFSNMELNAIKSLMPGLGPAESPERSKLAVNGLRKVLAEKGAHAASALKRELPAEILNTLSEFSDKELVSEVQNGALDKEIFWKVYDFKRTKGK